MLAVLMQTRGRLIRQLMLKPVANALWLPVFLSSGLVHAFKTSRHSSPYATLREPLSGTFLQTLLPDLVTPLKGHSYLPAIVQRRGQRPPKSSGTNMTVEVT